MSDLYIFGISTTARSIWKFVGDYNLFNIKGFVVDAAYKTCDTYCGLPVFELENLPESFDKDKDLLFIAMEWDRLNAVRKNIYLRLKKEGFRFANIISPHALLHSDIEGENCWICDKVVIENDVIIHDNVFVKTGATIAHFSEVGAHAFIGANSFTAGNCKIGEQTYLGICSTIFNSVKVGSKCLVGACVYVKRNLADNSVIKTKNDEFVITQFNEEEIESKLLASIKIR